MTHTMRCEGCRKDKKLCEPVPGESRCKRCIEKGRQNCQPKWPAPRNPAPGKVVADIDDQSNCQQYPVYQPTTAPAYPSTDPFTMANYAGFQMTGGYPYDSRASMNWSSDAARSSYEQASSSLFDSAFVSSEKKGTIPSQALLKKPKQKRGWPQQ